MKKISTLSMIIWMLLNMDQSGFAQTIYTVNTNKSWSTAGYTSSNSTFNIASGVTLTIDQSFTCTSCTFVGGNIAITQNLTCQPCTFSGNTITMDSKILKPNSSTTSFSNVNFTLSGTGYINANTPVTITNSTFTFNNTSYFFNNGGKLDLTASTFRFKDNAYFYANAGPVNLVSTSRFVAGDGSTSSQAYIYFNGPVLNIYDNSSVSLANNNNYYFNWAAYKSVSNNKSYSLASPPKQYGCGILNSSGISSCTLLAATLSDFTAGADNYGSVGIRWTTAQETSTDHFVVERSANTSSWEAIGTVQAKKYSSVSNDYQFTDASPLSGVNYYRLKTVDQDGKTTYSKTISVQMAAASKAMSIFPNPVTNSSFTVKLPAVDAIVVNVFTIQGQLLYTASLKGQLQYQVKLPVASHSDYLVIQVISNGKTQVFTVLNK